MTGLPDGNHAGEAKRILIDAWQVECGCLFGSKPGVEEIQALFAPNAVQVNRGEVPENVEYIFGLIWLADGLGNLRRGLGCSA